MIWFIGAVILAAIDIGMKIHIRDNRRINEETRILGGKVTITRVQNKGAFLGLMKNNTKKVLGLSLIITGIIAGMLLAATGKKGNLFLRIGLTLMLGGAMSNVYERIRHGEVTDFFRLSGAKGPIKKIAFNVGDWFIFLGALITLFARK